jgi:RHS repeat-associated protein
MLFAASQIATPQGALTYTYDAAGNLASMASSNANGASVSYTFDSLNRLATVVDNRLPAGRNTTTYAYDPASNLATVTYPNGLESQFTYDDLNHVTAMNAAKASYSYTLSPTGNRTGAVESSGRTLNWSYDGIYRLTNETISLDPHSVNGSVGYGLDPVGNRQSQTSSIPGIGSGSFTYDPDDRLSTETYDANGNTLTSGGKTFTYDFENRLRSMTEGTVTVTIQYDADGNRVAKTVNGVTTRYLVDDLNPTGYAQVVEEVTAGVVTRQYTYGLQRISQTQQIANAWTPAFYGYDGAGTVRLLTDSTGTVTDTYDYDAWGNTVNTTGSTPNVYLYRGEQCDSDLGLHYLRARHFNPLTGRFVSRDPYAGDPLTPITLHRYFYAGGNPVNLSDPSGMLVRLPIAPAPPAPAPTQPRTHLRAASEYVILVTMMGGPFAAMLLPDGPVNVSAQDVKCIWQMTTSVVGLGIFVDSLAPGVSAAGLRYTKCGVSIDTYSGAPSAQPQPIQPPQPEPAPQPEPQPAPNPAPQAGGKGCDPGAEGRDVHELWNPGPYQDGWRKEFAVPGGRIDAVNLMTHLVLELKPCNAPALCKGRSQLRRYVGELQNMLPGTTGLWIGRTVCYQRNSSGGYDFHYQ